jgi:hypothetical protein
MFKSRYVSTFVREDIKSNHKDENLERQFSYWRRHNVSYIAMITRDSYSFKIRKASKYTMLGAAMKEC